MAQTAHSTKASLIFCPHCFTYLSLKAYDTHKRLFYDGDTNQWIKKTCLTTEEHRQELASTEQAVEECDFDFGGEEHDGGHVSEVDSRPPMVDFEDDPNITQDIDSSFEPDFELMTPEVGGKVVAHICCVNFWFYHNSTFHGCRYHHSTIIIIKNNFDKLFF